MTNKTLNQQIKVGDIFYSSWGYDQTNIDFYQVTRVISDKTIELRPIQSKKFNDDHVIPVENSFTGDSFKRRIRRYESGVFCNGECSFMTASLWDGKPRYETPFGYGH